MKNAATQQKMKYRHRFGTGLLGDQKGTALVLALAILAVMSILGALALSTTNTELGITRNYRSSQEAFYAAERAQEYASVAGHIYSTIGVGAPVGLNTDDANKIAVDHGTYTTGLDTDATNEVGYLTSGPLPPSSGSDATLFELRYYRVSVTGKGPDGAIARVESQIGRLVPK
jgi:type IV pilus assembly protein PilX